MALPLSACVLPGVDEDDDAAEGSTGASTAPATSGDTEGESEGSAATTGATETSAEESGSSESGEGSTTDDPTPAMCTNATLLAGNPYFSGDFEGWNPDGQPLLADPPLRMRHLAATNGQLAIETQQEVWLADDQMVRRIAGDELEAELQYQPSGACEDVRVIIAEGLTALPNGNLVLIDTMGNGVIELTDPTGDCQAHPIAGTQEGVLDVDVSDDVHLPGDVDGPGAQALFYGPERPTADADGNIYLYDSGNAKIKRIAGDADRTVSTVFEMTGDEFVLAMTVMDGMLYATGQSAIEDIIWAIDPATGEGTELYRGRGLFEEVDSSQQLTLFAAANDGVDLLVGSNKGYIFRLSKDGEPLGAIAGMGQIVDYPTDIDLSMPVALDQLPIRSYEIGDASLVRLGDDFVFTGNAGGVGFHLWALHCG